MFNNFFDKKKVFVTGHTGFKGSWLLLWLKHLGAELKGYALEPKTENDHYVSAGLDNIVHSEINDIRNLQALKKSIIDFSPDVVFHLAAQPLVRQSYADPRETYEVNVMGTVNLFEAVRSCSSILSVINVTSDKCYENTEKEEGYVESDRMGGHDPYSSSKGCAELVTAAFRKSYFDRTDRRPRTMAASVRAGNVIGGGDWSKDRIMTDAVTALINSKEIAVRNPDAVRPWQHVLEPLSGYLWLAAQSESKNAHTFSGGWNFGPKAGSFTKVREVVEHIIYCWGSGSWTDASDPDAPHETRLLKLDCTKAEKQLAWTPVLDVKESIKLSVDWYKNYIAHQTDMSFFSKAQLEKYVEQARSKGIKWAISTEPA